tara:strand:- start:178 stop:303 length:126 start_codon:yes stop_codon:yes gene_type:complete
MSIPDNNYQRVKGLAIFIGSGFLVMLSLWGFLQQELVKEGE